MTLRLTDAEGRVKEFRNGLHKFGAANPFTLALISSFIVGIVVWLIKPG